jgi:two-component system OmpR family response regulator
MSDHQRVLVVDDDPDIVQLLSRYLGGHGFQVAAAGDGAQLRASMAGASPDLVLLDLGLPDEDGLSLLRHLHTQCRVPVIVVSGRAESVDRIVGLELGADDYVTKPFDFRELLARIRSVLRRTRSHTVDVPAAAHRLAFDGLTLNLSSRHLADRNGTDVPLTTGEFDLLHALLARPLQVLTRDHLMNSLHGRDAGPFDRAIDVQVGRLRRKIEADPASPRLIKSVRGSGYLFAVGVGRS